MLLAVLRKPACPRRSSWTAPCESWTPWHLCAAAAWVLLLGVDAWSCRQRDKHKPRDIFAEVAEGTRRNAGSRNKEMAQAALRLLNQQRRPDRDSPAIMEPQPGSGRQANAYSPASSPARAQTARPRCVAHYKEQGNFVLTPVHTFSREAVTPGSCVVPPSCRRIAAQPAGERACLWSYLLDCT